MTDPVTEARERLLERLYPMSPNGRTGFMWRAYDQTKADLDNLIALARAEAGVSVERKELHASVAVAVLKLALLDPEAFRALLDGPKDEQRDVAYAIAQRLVSWSALAARSAGSGSRVEARCAGCEEAEDHPSHRTEYRALDFHRFVPIDEPNRPTPPPAVDGTRCGECPHAAHTGDICDTDRPGFVTGCPCRTATPPTPADRLRALEAALRDWVEEVGLHDACDPDEFCSLLGDLRKKEPAARALLGPDGAEGLS